MSSFLSPRLGIPPGALSFSPALARLLLGQFSENPPPSLSDQIPHPSALIWDPPGLPSARILSSQFSQNSSDP